MNQPELESILAEQRRCAAYLAEHPNDDYAWLGLQDLVKEELLIMAEEA